MPPDIRSFFGGKSEAKMGKAIDKVDNSGAGNKRRNKTRMIVDDSDEDSPMVINTTLNRAAKKNPVKESPKGEETTTTDYFASSSKHKAVNSLSGKPKFEAEAPIPSKSTPKKSSTQIDQDAVPNSRGSRRKVPMTSYSERKGSDENTFSNEDASVDTFPTEVKGRKSKGDMDTGAGRDKELAPTPKKTAIHSKPKLHKPKGDMKDIDIATSNGLAKDRGQLPSTRKRKSAELEGHDFDTDDFASPTNYSGSKAGGAKKPPAKKARSSVKNEVTPESPAIQAIFDSIPIVKAPSPPPKDLNTKFNWRTGGAGNAGPAPAAGTKEIPTGADNCLAGLTFVFTGLLESISRDEGQELVKRYGGKVTGQPSSKTSYVILGSDAGPSKLDKIQKMNIKTINEDGLFELIRRLPASGGDGKAAEKNIEKKRADEQRIKLEAAEMELEEERLAVEAKKVAQKAAAARGLPSVVNGANGITQASQLWTVKYAPTKANQICGNKAQVEKIQNWLSKWPKSRKFNFELPGPDGSGKYRAIIVHGPPGIGKTTAAHLAAKLEGYDVIESNASDSRSKKLVESGLSDVLDNSSLLGFFAGDGMTVDKKKKKIVLIMDEVDGMSAGDRGGASALAKVCKKTEIPIILICNERRLPKMKPFDHVTFDIQFKRPTVEQVRSRIATICARERLNIPVQVMDALIEGSNKDIRQIINMLSTTKLDQTSMNFDQGKSMSKSWEKHIVLKPWDICHRLLGSGLFAPSSRATLNDKIELYFHDHEFSFLMVQENYLSTKPFLATNRPYSPREYKLRLLELADKAAESVSDGDLVDRMIHSSQQHWSLMPTHAVFSTVRPSSFMSGVMTGNSSFTQWLGNNSKYGKHTRFIKEIQSHMRLRTSGDRHEIRQQYLPVLWDRLIKRLEIEGKDYVREVIDLMDSYFLTRDDYEYIMELGLGPQRQENVDLPPATKANFTRTYNIMSHPLPFMKASNVTATARSTKEIPDLEEAIEEDDDETVAEPKVEDEEEFDISKDKYIKQPKTKLSVGKAAVKNRKTSRDVEDANGSEEIKPKKARVGKSKGATTNAKVKT